MDGLLDFIKTPEGQGLLAAGFGGLANARRGAPLNTLGGAGMAGLHGYASAQDRQLKMAEEAQMRQLREQQIQQAKYANEQAAADRDLNNMAAKFYRPAQDAMPAGQKTSVDEYGQTVGGEMTPTTSASEGGFDQKAFVREAMSRYPIKAAALAKSLQGETNWVAAKQFDKDNNIIHGFVNTKAANPATTFTPLGGESEKQKLEMLNLGGSVRPTNAYTAAPAGADISTIVKPDTTADIQSREKMAGLGRAQSESHFQQGMTAPQYMETEGGIIALPKKLGAGQMPTATPVMSTNGQPVLGKQDANVKKELMSIAQQKAAITGAIADVETNPTAFSFGRGVAGKMPFGETLAGRGETDAQTQARAYVFNNVSKIINERAGAAQSAQELSRLNSFLPADTDSPKQIVNKLKSFEKYLADSESAVRGMKPINNMSPTKANAAAMSPDINALLKKYGGK